MRGFISVLLLLLNIEGSFAAQSDAQKLCIECYDRGVIASSRLIFSDLEKQMKGYAARCALFEYYLTYIGKVPIHEHSLDLRYKKIKEFDCVKAKAAQATDQLKSKFTQPKRP